MYPESLNKFGSAPASNNNCPILAASILFFLKIGTKWCSALFPERSYLFISALPFLKLIKSLIRKYYTFIIAIFRQEPNGPPPILISTPAVNNILAQWYFSSWIANESAVWLSSSS